MKKVLLIIFLVGAAVTAGAQVVQGAYLVLRGYRVDTIKNDTVGWANRSKTLPTAKAVYDFVTGRAGGSGSSPTFTTGSIPYAGTSGALTQTNTKFFFDSTNNQLLVGTNAVSNPITGAMDQFRVFNSTGNGQISIRNDNGGGNHIQGGNTSSGEQFQIDFGSPLLSMGVGGTTRFGIFKNGGGIYGSGLMAGSGPGANNFDFEGYVNVKEGTLKAAAGGSLKDFYTDASNTTTTETDLYSYTTPASTLSVNGEKLVVEFTVVLTDGTADKVLKMYFGTQAWSSGTLTGLTGDLKITMTVIRVSATVVRVSTLGSISTSSASFSSYTEITGLTLSNTNVLKLTGQASGAGGGSGDITAKLGAIYWYPAANN